MKGIKLALTAMLLLVLPGCWNSKDIQNMAYVTAMGLDYEGDHFVVYAQVMNFSNIARSENLQIGKITPIWIGKGTGKTISGAFHSLNATSQLRMFWGHVKVIVCSERLMRHGVQEVYNAINRYREVRYNILVYGTKEKLEDILTQQSLLDLSPLDSVMFSPGVEYNQLPSVLPVSGNRFIAEVNEPGDPAILPGIGLDRTAWEQDKKKKSMFRITGAFFFEGAKLLDWMPLDDIRGARWTHSSISKTPMAVPDEDHPVAAVVLRRPHYAVHPRIVDGEARFAIHIKVKGYMDELLHDATIRELERMTSRAIAEEVRETYQNGFKKRCDTLKLQTTFYRRYPRQWQEMTKNGEWILRPDSLSEVRVTVNIQNTGKYKGRTE